MKVYNVLDYNAVGNGVTDDTLAIQRAIDEAHTSNATVYFPPGRTYRITRSLRICGVSSTDQSGRKRGLTLCGPPAGESYGVPIRTSGPPWRDSAVILWDPEINDRDLKANISLAQSRYNRILFERYSALEHIRTNPMAELPNQPEALSVARSDIRPMIELWSRDCTISDLHFACAKHKIAYSAIQMTRPYSPDPNFNSALDTSTNNKFVRVSIGHNEDHSDGHPDDNAPGGIIRLGSFVFGITIGDAVDVSGNITNDGKHSYNCDYGVFESCRFRSIIEACVFSKNTTGQSKHHIFDRCSFGFSKYGIWFFAGSFRTIHCTATSISRSIYHIEQPTDSIEIRSMDVESCRRLFTSAHASSNPWPVTIDGGRYEVGDQEYPVTEYISFCHHGPLTIRGANFHGANPGFHIKATNGTGNPVQVILDGCAFPNENPIPEYIGQSSNRWYIRGCQGVLTMSEALDSREPEIKLNIKNISIPDLTPGIGRVYIIDGYRGIEDIFYRTDSNPESPRYDVIASVPILHGPSTMVDIELRATDSSIIESNVKERPSAMWAHKTFFSNPDLKPTPPIQPVASTGTDNLWSIVLAVSRIDELSSPNPRMPVIQEIVDPLASPKPIIKVSATSSTPLRDIDLEIRISRGAPKVANHHDKLFFVYRLNSRPNNEETWSPYFLIPFDSASGNISQNAFIVPAAGVKIEFPSDLTQIKNDEIYVYKFKIRSPHLLILAKIPEVKNGTYWYGTIRINSTLSTIVPKKPQ